VTYFHIVPSKRETPYIIILKHYSPAEKKVLIFVSYKLTNQTTDADKAYRSTVLLCITVCPLKFEIYLLTLVSPLA